MPVNLHARMPPGYNSNVRHASQPHAGIVATPASATAVLVVVLLLWSGCGGLSDSDRQRLALEHFDEGVRLQNSGQAEQAVAEYDEAVELDPRYAEAYYWRGAPHLALGNLEEAVNDHATAIFINPRYGTATLLEPYESALTNYDAALNRDPEDAGAYAARALAYAIFGREDASLEDMRQAELLGFDPGSLRELVRELGEFDAER